MQGQEGLHPPGAVPPPLCMFLVLHTTLGHDLKCPAELSVLDLGAVSGSPAGVAQGHYSVSSHGCFFMNQPDLPWPWW